LCTEDNLWEKITALRKLTQQPVGTL